MLPELKAPPRLPHLTSGNRPIGPDQGHGPDQGDPQSQIARTAHNGRKQAEKNQMRTN